MQNTILRLWVHQHPTDASSFLYELIHIEKGNKTINCRATPSENVPFNLIMDSLALEKGYSLKLSSSCKWSLFFDPF